MAPSSIPILRLVQQDAYYAPLLVLAVPVTIAAVSLQRHAMQATVPPDVGSAPYGHPRRTEAHVPPLQLSS